MTVVAEYTKTHGIEWCVFDYQKRGILNLEI